MQELCCLLDPSIACDGCHGKWCGDHTGVFYLMHPAIMEHDKIVWSAVCRKSYLRVELTKDIDPYGTFKGYVVG